MDDDSAAFAFIDESYSVPGKFVSKTFYILAVAVVPKELMAELRLKLVDVAGTDFIHTTELLKSAAGRETLLSLCRLIPEDVRLFAYLLEPLLWGDKNGEASRVHIFSQVVRELANFSSNVIYEIRRDGYMRAADNRMDNKLRADHAGLSIRPKNASEEKLLWIPDLVAGAVRQQVMRQNGLFLAAFLRPVSLVPLTPPDKSKP